jgi:hypothetical protein
MNKPTDHWVLITKASQETGYTEAAIRTKIKRQVWQRDTHWRKAPDNRLFVNLTQVQRWVAGK